MLEPEKPSNIPNRVQPPPPPVVIDGEPEFEISEILDSKIDKRRRPCQLLYLVQWTGYEGTDEETSWIVATELPHVSELVADFHTVYPNNPGPYSTFSASPSSCFSSPPASGPASRISASCVFPAGTVDTAAARSSSRMTIPAWARSSQRTSTALSRSSVRIQPQHRVNWTSSSALTLMTFNWLPMYSPVSSTAAR